MVGTAEELVLHKQEELKLKVASDDAAELTTRIWQIHYAKAEDFAVCFRITLILYCLLGGVCV